MIIIISFSFLFLSIIISISIIAITVVFVAVGTRFRTNRWFKVGGGDSYWHNIDIYHIHYRFLFSI